MKRTSPCRGVNRHSYVKQRRQRRLCVLASQGGVASMPVTEDPVSMSVPQHVAEVLKCSVVDCGDVMQGLADCESFSNKCVQNSVLYVLPDRLARRARYLMLCRGMNNAPTGQNGNEKCAWNLHVLQKVLRMIHASCGSSLRIPEMLWHLAGWKAVGRWATRTVPVVGPLHGSTRMLMRLLLPDRKRCPPSNKFQI